MFNKKIDGTGSFTTASPMGTWIGSPTDSKTNKNFDWQERILRREMKPKNSKGKKGWGNRNRQKRYITKESLFLFMRATPDTLANT